MSPEGIQNAKDRIKQLQSEIAWFKKKKGSSAEVAARRLEIKTIRDALKEE